MNYWIQALSTGHCEVRDFITFHDSWEESTRRFELWIWLVRGGDRPILVDTGPRDVAGFNRGTARYIPAGVVQRPDQRTPEALAAAGIDPAEIGTVIVTHLHGDHYDYFDLFPHARLVVNREEFAHTMPDIPRRIMRALADRWPESVRLVDDEEVEPGIRVFPVGCHSVGSQAVAIDTADGTAVLTGDLAYLYENVDNDRPIQCDDPEAWRAAIARVRREGTIVLPAHDPAVADRHPGGIIGRPPRPADVE